MEDLISRLEAVPLSGEDLVMMANKMGNNDVRFYLYAELKTITTVDELLKGANGNALNTAFVLFDIIADGQIAPVGHWAAIMRSDHGVSYYDPYGLALGQDLELSGEAPYLQDILGGQTLDQNHFRDQNFKDELNTCGRHCVVRSIFWFMTNAQYQDLVIAPLRRTKMVKDPDAMVSLMTAFLDNSDRVVFEFFVKRVMSGDASVWA